MMSVIVELLHYLRLFKTVADVCEEDVASFHLLATAATQVSPGSYERMEGGWQPYTTRNDVSRSEDW
jgi:hypothetical protein